MLTHHYDNIIFILENNFVVDHGQDNGFLKLIKNTPEYERSVELAKKYYPQNNEYKTNEDKIETAYEKTMKQLKDIVVDMEKQYKRNN